MKVLTLLLGCLITSTAVAQPAITREPQILSGWTVHVDTQLKQQNAAALQEALTLLKAQLDAIVRVVPQPAVQELQKVPLWFSREYPGIRPRAEYHPDAKWLAEHGRDPVMAKGVEFTNSRIFAAETRRMPNFALHELAHAYHDLVLGFDQAEIKAAYEAAKASGSYNRVERKDSEGRSHFDRAYAMTNEKEYFAECTEAFFAKNDFFPFNRSELEQHDPRMVEVLQKVWKVKNQP